MSDPTAAAPAAATTVLLPGTFGALLIGTWVNAGLYTIELQQVRYLFRNYKDPFTIRMAALLALLSDTLCTTGSFAAIYLYLITHWGDAPYLARQWWPIPMYVYTTGTTAAIVQAFLIYRVFILSKNYLITFVLGATAATAFVSSVVTATWLVRFPTFDERFTLKVPATIWFTSSAVSDVAVACALVWQLQRTKTGFKSTQSLVRRLSGTALKSGSACATIALVTMSLYLQDNQSQIAVGFAFCFGRIYSLTMLYNLNTRKHGRHTGNSGGTHTTGDLRDGAINLSGIQVQRSIRVDEDARGRAGTLETERKLSEEDFYAANKAAPFAQV